MILENPHTFKSKRIFTIRFATYRMRHDNRRRHMKLNKSQWQLDFKSSIIIPCIIAITLITILLFIFPSIRYSALFSAQAENYSQNIIRQTNLGISQSLHQFETKVKNLIDDPEIRNFIISNESTDDFQYSFQNIIESYFQVNSLDAYYLEGLDLYLLHKKGSLHYGYKNTSLSDIQTSPYYRNALIYPTNLNWLPYNQKEECLELSMCIYNYTDYSLEGIVVIRLSQSFLLDKFQTLNIINADCMYILNENRQSSVLRILVYWAMYSMALSYQPMPVDHIQALVSYIVMLICAVLYLQFPMINGLPLYKLIIINYYLVFAKFQPDSISLLFF